MRRAHHFRSNLLENHCQIPTISVISQCRVLALCFVQHAKSETLIQPQATSRQADTDEKYAIWEAFNKRNVSSNPRFAESIQQVSQEIGSYNPIKVFIINIKPLHGLQDVSGKSQRVLNQRIGSILIERVARIQFQKEKVESEKHRVERKYRRPVFSQDIKTHISFEINIGMVYFLNAFDLGRVDGEVVGDVDGKSKHAGFVMTFYGTDFNEKVKKVL